MFLYLSPFVRPIGYSVLHFDSNGKNDHEIVGISDSVW